MRSVDSLYFHDDSIIGRYYYSHFAHEDTEAGRDGAICSKFHEQEVLALGVASRPSFLLAVDTAHRDFLYPPGPACRLLVTKAHEAANRGVVDPAVLQPHRAAELSREGNEARTPAAAPRTLQSITLNVKRQPLNVSMVPFLSRARNTKLQN